MIRFLLYCYYRAKPFKWQLSLTPLPCVTLCLQAYLTLQAFPTAISSAPTDLVCHALLHCDVPCPCSVYSCVRSTTTPASVLIMQKRGRLPAWV
jgi:hypothetical protein